MKIIFFEATEEEKKSISDLLKGADINFYEDKLSPLNAGLANEADIVSVFVSSEVNKEIIDLLPKLKLITTRSTGYDHIDVAYAKSKGIAVSYIPAYGSKTVAEFTFAHILNLSRNISKACNQMKAGVNYSPAGLEGFDLSGKTIGVLGTGRIGKNVIRIAKGFGMKIYATDMYPDDAFAEEIGFEYVPLDELLSASDIVTVHTPYNESTFHLINENNIKYLKKGAYLVNTARGEIVDTKALIAGLKDGAIAGAGLDVLEGERVFKAEKMMAEKDLLSEQDKELLKINHELLSMPNVYVSPHVAYCSREAIMEIIKSAAENITSFAAGQPVNIL